MSMTKVEFSPTENISAAIQRETKRVIDDHLPTIYSVDIAEENELYSQEEVARHIQEYFSVADTAIQAAGNDLQIHIHSIELFKLLFRKLHTVVSIESHLAAISQGWAVATQLAGGHAEDVLLCSKSIRKSAQLFQNSAKLGMGRESLYPSHNHYQVLLMIDDVSHSGEQMSDALYGAKIAYPKLKIVISLGAVTRRALSQIQNNQESGDKVIYQEKKLALDEMIAQIKSASTRNELERLAEVFLLRHTYAVAAAMTATHIITPFKMPDGVSNGLLSGLKINGIFHSFAMKEVYALRDRLYPEVL